MSTSESKTNRNYFWSFCPLDFYDCTDMSNEQAGKIFKEILGQLIKNKVPENSMAYPMYLRTMEYREKKRMAINKRWHPEQFMEQEPEKTETQAQQPTHQQIKGSPPPQCVIDAQRRAPRPRPTAKPSKPRDREEFKQFVAAADLHIGLSEEWYEISAGRGWTFQDGSPIRDWRAAVTNYCHKVEQQRNSTQEK